MSFLNKVYKINKVSIYKGLGAFQKPNSTVKCFSSVHNNSSTFKKIKSNIFSNKHYYSASQIQTRLYNHYEHSLNHAHKILTNSENCPKSLADLLPEKKDVQISDIQDILDKPWTSMSIEELLQNFEFISHYAKINSESISDPKYQNTLEVITSRIQSFSDEEIQYLLKCLVLWNALTKDEIYKKLWTAIDLECLTRFKKEDWSLDKILLINDLFYNLKLNRPSEFSWHSLSKVGQKILKVNSASQLAHFVFFMKTCRFFRMNVYNVEYAFEQYADEFTIEELGIFAMAFSKYKTTIKSKDFLLKIIQKLIDNMDTASDLTIISILNILRSIESQDYIEHLERLTDAFESQISIRRISTVTRFVGWLKEVRLERKDIISKILERCEKEVTDIQLKGFELIYYALFTFNYDPKTTPFYSIGMNELLKPERAEEIQRHIKSFMKINLSIIHQQFYSEEALKQVLAPEVAKKFAHYTLVPTEHLSLNYIVEIEHPYYNGPRLDKSYVQILVKRLGVLNNYQKRSNTKIISRYNCLSGIKSACQQIIGFESVIHEDYLLPHLPIVDLILCYNPETNNYVSPAEQLSQIPLGEIKYAPKDGKEWYTLVLAPPLVYTKNTKKPTGFVACRMRLLKRIGYEPILINLRDWVERKEESEKQKFMRDLLIR